MLVFPGLVATSRENIFTLSFLHTVQQPRHQHFGPTNHYGGVKDMGLHSSWATCYYTCDNENSVLSLNSGRSRTRGKHAPLYSWNLISELHIDHVQGPSNTIAEHLSRWHLSSNHKADFEALPCDTSTVHVSCPPECFNFDLYFYRANLVVFGFLDPGPVLHNTNRSPSTLPELHTLVKDIQAQPYAPGTMRNLGSRWKTFW